MSAALSERECELIFSYFHLGLAYMEILEALAWRHGIVISK